jgi:hypothetical protein
MSRYLKNDYFTKLRWDENTKTASVEFPPDVISVNQRPIITKTYKFYDNKLVFNNSKNIIAPKYTLRVLTTIDIFLSNIICNIPRSETYLETDKGWSQFQISHLNINLSDEEKDLEWKLSQLYQTPTDKRQAQSIELGIEDGFELVSDLLKLGGF